MSSFSQPSAAGADNKTSVATSWGDPDWATCTSPMGDEHDDFGQDSSGVTNPGLTNKTDMDMNLAPNMFPRETGHDSLTEEEAQLS